MEFSREASKELSFGSQPSEDDLKDLAAKGIKTIINVRSPDEEEPNFFPDQEKAAAESLGMRYVNVPMGMSAINDDVVDKVRQAMTEATTMGPAFVH